MKNRNRKKIIYGVVMIAVFLWLIFANIIMARLLSNEALTRVIFPDFVENETLQYAFEPLQYDEFTGIFSLDGWAFIPTDTYSDSRSVSMVARSAQATYSGEVQNFGARPDLEHHFSRLSIDTFPEQAGFRASFPVANLQNGVYEVCINIYENEQTYGLIATGIFFEKNGRNFGEVNSIKGNVEFVPTSVQQLPTAQGTANMFALNSVDIDDEILSIHGWGAMEGKESLQQNVSMMLTNEEGEIVEFPTMCILSEGVAEVYENDDYLYSGFAAQMPTEHLEDGQYSLTFFIENDGIIEQSPRYSLFIDGSEVEYDLDFFLPEAQPPAEVQGTIALFDLQQPEVVEDKLLVQGWGAVEGEDSSTQNVRFLLTDDTGEMAAFSTLRVQRSDVAEYYENESYLNSGFLSEIPLEYLEDGRYTLAFFIENNGVTQQSQNYILEIDGQDTEYSIEGT